MTKILNIPGESRSDLFELDFFDFYLGIRRQAKFFGLVTAVIFLITVTTWLFYPRTFSSTALIDTGRIVNLQAVLGGQGDIVVPLRHNSASIAALSDVGFQSDLKSELGFEWQFMATQPRDSTFIQLVVTAGTREQSQTAAKYIIEKLSRELNQSSEQYKKFLLGRFSEIEDYLARTRAELEANESIYYKRPSRHVVQNMIRLSTSIENVDNIRDRLFMGLTVAENTMNTRVVGALTTRGNFLSFLQILSIGLSGSLLVGFVAALLRDTFVRQLKCHSGQL